MFWARVETAVEDAYIVLVAVNEKDLNCVSFLTVK